ncbi:MAG: hypothetical protein NC131_20215, partial [Roseburia sp.]|nr:hypothetical protein [Roseburia sp.]
MAALIVKYRIIILLFILFGINKGNYLYAQADPTAGKDSIEVHMEASVYTDPITSKLMYKVDYSLRRLTEWVLKDENGQDMPGFFTEFEETTTLFGVQIFFRWFNSDETTNIWENFVGSGDIDKDIVWAGKWEWADRDQPNVSPYTRGRKVYATYDVNAYFHEFGDRDPNYTQWHGVIYMDSPSQKVDYLMLFPNTEDYLPLGTLTWELQPTASGKVGIWRDIFIDVKGASQEFLIAGQSVDASIRLNVKYTGTGIVDLGGDIEPPVFAEDMDTVSCGHDFPWSWDYALNSENTPKGADTCIWFVKDASLPIVAVDSGSKVTIAWPGAGDYTIGAYSKNTTSGAVSDTVYQTVHIKNMPTADLDTITYACENSVTVSFTNLNPVGTTTTWLYDTKVPIGAGGNATSLSASVGKVFYLALDYQGCQDTLKTETRLAQPSVNVNRELTACGDTINLWVNSFVGNLHWLKEDRVTPLPGDQPLVYSEFGQAAKSYWVYADISNNGQFCNSDTFPVTVYFRTKPTVDVGMNGMFTSCDANSGELFYSNLSVQATTHWLRQDYTVASAANENPFAVTKTNATDYYYLAIDAGSCGDTIPVSITFGTRPTADVALLQTACDPDYGTLRYTSISAGTAKWYNNNYTASSTDNPYAVVASQSGRPDIYHLVVTDGGCADTLDVTLEFGTRPVVSVTSPLTSCENNLTLSASSSDNSTILKWLDSDHTALPSTTVFDTGVYYVYADGGTTGCMSDTMSVTVELNSRPVVTVTDPLTSCDNQLTLTAACSDNNATLKWLKNDRTTLLPSAIVTASGTYYVYADGGTGCMSDTVAVNVQLGTKPVITVTDPLTSCDNLLTLSATCSDNSANLKWLDNNKGILSSTTVSTGGTYYVYADGGTGCVSDTMSVTVELGTKPVITVT